MTDQDRSHATRVRQQIIEARQGNVEAMGSAVESCRRYLLRMANSQLKGQILGKIGASDMVQLTLIEACEDFCRFHGNDESELLAWLSTILHNNIASARRAFSTQKRSLGREVKLTSDATPAGGLRATTNDQLLLTEERDQVLQAIQKLPEHIRQVILLRHEEKLRFHQIASRVNRTPEAVRKLWARGVQMLKKELTRNDQL